MTVREKICSPRVTTVAGAANLDVAVAMAVGALIGGSAAMLSGAARSVRTR